MVSLSDFSSRSIFCISQVVVNAGEIANEAIVVIFSILSTYIADSAQTEYCTTFHCPGVRVFVTGVTSHISHIYKGINAMLIIRGPIKPYIF